MRTKVVSKITLDISGIQREHIVVRAKQGDRSTRFICATIVNGEEQVLLRKGDLIKINILRADNLRQTINLNNDETSCEVLFAIPEWALELPYTATCDLSIVDIDGKKITTSTFYIQVDAAAVADDEIEI